MKTILLYNTCFDNVFNFYFEKRGFIVIKSKDFNNDIQNYRADVIIIGSKKEIALNLIREIRYRTKAIIIYQLKTDDLIDRIVFLSIGAEEIISLSPNLRYLETRIRRLLSKGISRESKDELYFDALSKTLKKGRTIISLNNRERDFVYILVSNNYSVLSRLDLINNLNLNDKSIRSVDVTIRNIRVKLMKLSFNYGHNFIETVRNGGYKINDNFIITQNDKNNFIFKFKS